MRRKARHEWHICDGVCVTDIYVAIILRGRMAVNYFGTKLAREAMPHSAHSTRPQFSQ